jgi:ligand-binding sensor domain-containing protein
MKKIILILLFIISTVYGQSNRWKVITNETIGIQSSGISSIVEDMDSNIWIGTWTEGLFKFDGDTWINYDTSNTSLLVNGIWTLRVESNNTLWIGTLGFEGGLAKFDGSEWRVWELDNYGIEGTTIFDIEIDNEGYFWMGTLWDGLVKFDGDTTFTIYNSTNSNLPPAHEEINVLSIDDSGYVWYGSDTIGGGKFDRDSTWIIYANSQIDFAIYSLDIDIENNIWFGGTNFISKFDGVSDWTTFDYPDGGWYVQMELDTSKIVWFASWLDGFLKLDYSNGEQWEHIYPPNYPELMNEGCWGLTRDSKGNFWIGYNNGYIAVYNPDAVSSIDDKENTVPENFILFQNYPNPFNPSTKIVYQIPELSFVTIKIYDVLGNEIAVLVNEEKPVGSYEVEYNASSLPSGVYFYQLNAGSFIETKKMILIK